MLAKWAIIWHGTLAAVVRVPFSLQWCHNERGGVSNHRRLVCVSNCLFMYRSKKTSELRVTGLYEGNSPVTGEFPTQRASNAENVSIRWRQHVISMQLICILCSRRLHLWCPVFKWVIVTAQGREGIRLSMCLGSERQTICPTSQKLYPRMSSWMSKQGYNSQGNLTFVPPHCIIRWW